MATAEAKGDLSEIKRILSLLSLAAGQFAEDIAEILKISLETIRQSVYRFLSGGAAGMASKSRVGRPPKLTKTQRKQLSKWIEIGPEKLGFPGYCWRTPMIQRLILEKFGIKIKGLCSLRPVDPIVRRDKKFSKPV